MSQSVDPGHFFQTDASEATRERKAAKSTNKNGNPITLQSKILAAVANPDSTSSIYVAESAGCVRKVDIKSREAKTVFRGPLAPVTSVAVGGAGGNTIFAGCWDKDIWSWDRTTINAGKRFKGHSDFVKTVLCTKLGGKDLLISGGADSRIIVWDTATGTKLHTLRDKLDNMMAIQSLVIDPIESNSSTISLLSASSDPTIRRWTIAVDSWSQVLANAPETTEQVSISNSLSVHETSIYAMSFTPGTDEAEDSDLWTASADGTAKCLSRTRNWEVEETFEHGDYVRDVALSTEFVITAGRNEDVKVWKRDTGKLWHVFEGHYEEVTGLVILGEGAEEKVVSVSIDRTVRIWPLEKNALDKAIKEREDREKGVAKEEVAKPVKKSLLTAEEEAELAELMSDSD